MADYPIVCKGCGAGWTFMGTDYCGPCLDKAGKVPEPISIRPLGERRVNTYTLVITDNGDGRTCTVDGKFALRNAPRTREEWSLCDKLGTAINEMLQRSGGNFTVTLPDNAEELNYDEVKAGKYGPN